MLKKLAKNFIESPITSITGVVVLVTTVIVVYKVPEIKIVWDGLAGFGLSITLGVLNEQKIIEIIDKVVTKLTK